MKNFYKLSYLKRIAEYNNYKKQNYFKNFLSNDYFFNVLVKTYNFLLNGKNNNVLQIGSKTGILLNKIESSSKLGIEFNEDNYKNSLKKFKNDQYIYDSQQKCFDLLNPKLKFDKIILSNLNELYDPLIVINKSHEYLKENGIVVVQLYNVLWTPIIKLSEIIGLKYKSFSENKFNIKRATQLFSLCNYNLIKKKKKIILPIYIPLLSYLLNELLFKLPILNFFCMVNILVFKSNINQIEKYQKQSISIVIPCKNEEDNIIEVLNSMPKFDVDTEILIGDDKSTDNTKQKVIDYIKSNKTKNIHLYSGDGISKSKNIYKGFDLAKNEIIVIQDGDLNQHPEEIHNFIYALENTNADFINGSRFLLQQEKGSMKFLNYYVNKFFAILISLIINEKITDSLCGTTVFYKSDWIRMRNFVDKWGSFDPWGDFELLFSASKLNLKIVDIPVHHLKRKKGESKMNKRFLNGFILLKLCIYAYFKLRKY